MTDTANADATGAPYLAVEGVEKHFGRFPALEEVSLAAGRGEFVCVLGPSGCGKTTLLRVVAGLERPEAGRVLIDGRDVSRLPVSRRNVGIVFQSYALFPNLTAAQNVGYGLTSLRTDRETARNRVRELLHLVGLQGMESKYPGQLSGGQQQRVALARAMALSPSLLLLDEPLSALDAQVRVTLRGEVKQLQRRLGVTTLMVTHDQEEALTMADRILVMDRGRVVQNGTPLEIYNKPATPFVAAFIGSMNFLRDAVKEAPGLFRLGEARLQVENGSGSLGVGSRALVAIRPEDIAVGNGATDAPNTFPARVEGLEFRGAVYRATLRLPLGANTPAIQADVAADLVRRRGIGEAAHLSVRLPPDRIRVYAA
jgi:iron(III) transport system ATP-binding protein